MTSSEGPKHSWNVVRLDTDAERWRDIAVDAFWLHSPIALDSDHPAEPPGMEEIAARFRKYGAELNVLEHDLTECLNEFKQAYEVLYRELGAITQRKFSIVYHTDNFLVRVHKFREDLYRLLALTVGLDHSAKPRRSDLSREEQVANAFERRRLHSIGKCVVQFDHNQRITAAITERNLFVHQFREDPKRPELGASSRVRDFEDGIAAQVSAITDLPAIDRYADRKADELLRILEAIREFRNTLYEAIEDEVIAILAKRSPETRRRFQPFVDLWNFRRGRGPLAE